MPLLYSFHHRIVTSFVLPDLSLSLLDLFLLEYFKPCEVPLQILHFQVGLVCTLLVRHMSKRDILVESNHLLDDVFEGVFIRAKRQAIWVICTFDWSTRLCGTLVLLHLLQFVD